MNIEFVTNLSAVICFVWLFYRLTMLSASAWIRFGQLRSNVAALQEFSAFCKQQHETADCQALLREAINAISTNKPKSKPLLQIISRVILLHRTNDHASAQQEVELMVESQAMQFTRHLQLAELANSIGMSYTVAGGILVFNTIGSSDDPFAAFQGMALAMITTLLGLFISIPTREILTVYGARIEAFETLINEITLQFTSRRLQNAPGPIHEPLKPNEIKVDVATRQPNFSPPIRVTPLADSYTNSVTNETSTGYPPGDNGHVRLLTLGDQA